MPSTRDPDPPQFRSGPYFAWPPGAEPPIIPAPLIPLDRNAVDVALLTTADQDRSEAFFLARQAAASTAFDPRRV